MFAGETTILPVFELDGKPAEEESYNLTSSDPSICGGNEVFLRLSIFSPPRTFVLLSVVCGGKEVFSDFLYLEPVIFTELSHNEGPWSLVGLIESKQPPKNTFFWNLLPGQNYL